MTETFFSASGLSPALPLRVGFPCSIWHFVIFVLLRVPSRPSHSLRRNVVVFWIEWLDRVTFFPQLFCPHSIRLEPLGINLSFEFRLGGIFFISWLRNFAEFSPLEKNGTLSFFRQRGT